MRCQGLDVLVVRTIVVERFYIFDNGSGSFRFSDRDYILFRFDSVLAAPVCFLIQMNFRSPKGISVCLHCVNHFLASHCAVFRRESLSFGVSPSSIGWAYLIETTSQQEFGIVSFPDDRVNGTWLGTYLTPFSLFLFILSDDRRLICFGPKDM